MPLLKKRKVARWQERAYEITGAYETKKYTYETLAERYQVSVGYAKRLVRMCRAAKKYPKLREDLSVEDAWFLMLKLEEDDRIRRIKGVDDESSKTERRGASPCDDSK